MCGIVDLSLHAVTGQKIWHFNLLESESCSACAAALISERRACMGLLQPLTRMFPNNGRNLSRACELNQRGINLIFKRSPLD